MMTMVWNHPSNDGWICTYNNMVIDMVGSKYTWQIPDNFALTYTHGTMFYRDFKGFFLDDIPLRGESIQGGVPNVIQGGAPLQLCERWFIIPIVSI